MNSNGFSLPPEYPPEINFSEAFDRDEKWLKELESSLPEAKPTCWNYAASRSMVLDLAREVVELRRIARHTQALQRSFRIYKFQPLNGSNPVDPAELVAMKKSMMDSITGKE